MGAATTNRGRPLQGAALGNSAITAEQLLEQAALVVRDRRHTYGQPRELFERVAVRWSQVLGVQVTARQVAACLVDLKVARLAHDRTDTQ